MQIDACSKYFTIVRWRVNFSFTFLKKIMFKKTAELQIEFHGEIVHPRGPDQHSNS